MEIAAFNSTATLPLIALEIIQEASAFSASFLAFSAAFSVVSGANTSVGR